MSIRVVVVEDEPDVLEELVESLEEDPLIEVCGQAQTVDDAFNVIRKTQPDALFLDIQLLGGTGFDLLQRLKDAGMPLIPVVINTGFESFEYARKALNDFGDRIVHILQKPFFSEWEKKRQQCLDKILSFQSADAEVSVLAGFQKFIARNRERTFLIDFADIQYLEVGGSGTTYIQAKDQEAIQINRTLTNILPELPAYIFQISRFHAVNLDAINYIVHDERKLLLKDLNQEFKVGDEFYKQLQALLR